MKQIVIIALILATVWGCSDDKVTTPDPVVKDTLEKTFVTIEGMINFVKIEEILDTLGDPSKLDKLCRMDDEYDVVVSPTVSYGDGSLYVPFDAIEVTRELIINIETAKVSSEIRDSVIARYGYFPEHKEFKNVEWFRDTIDNSSWGGFNMEFFNGSPGAYIVRVKRTGIDDRCVPFIRLGGENKE